jgi:hypothetical protein
MRNLFLSIAALFGATFFAAATPAQATANTLPIQEEVVINLETTNVDKYGTVDFGVTLGNLPDEASVTGDFGCGNGQCVCC